MRPLSYPRATIDGVTVISIDELDKVVQDNVNNRKEAVRDVERIIEAKVKEFYKKISSKQREASSDCYESAPRE